MNNENQHKPTCSRYCAIRHCACGAPAAHGTDICHPCARDAYAKKGITLSPITR